MVSVDDTAGPDVTVGVLVDGRPVGELVVDSTVSDGTAAAGTAGDGSLGDESGPAVTPPAAESADPLRIDVTVGAALAERASRRYAARLAADPGADVTLEDYLWEAVDVRLTAATARGATKPSATAGDGTGGGSKHRQPQN